MNIKKKKCDWTKIEAMLLESYIALQAGINKKDISQ